MSKVPEGIREPGNTRCELVSGDDISQLEGELKTYLETFGFEQRREKAVKDVLNTILWDWFNFIIGQELDHLSEKKRWYKENKEL